MFIPSTFKRPVSSWKALNLRKTLLMASSVRLKPLNCSRLPRSEERFSRNAETDLVCRLLLEKKKGHIRVDCAAVPEPRVRAVRLWGPRCAGVLCRGGAGPGV